MKKQYIYSLLVLVSLAMAGCASEAPFSTERENGKNKYGEFRKSALTFDVKEEDGVQVHTRATAVTIDDFQLTFLRDGVVERTIQYGDMPEVMLLEQGSYTIQASYGADLEAEWDNPLFEGQSDEFEVSPQIITSSIDPIVCRLKNVKVSVAFDPELAAVAGDESYIEVKVKNNSKGLKFYKDQEKMKKPGTTDEYYEAGYFRINDETTLVATFYGSIYGTDIEQETKSLADISGGNHYKMTFSLHSHNSANSGDSNGQVNVDGSVEYENMETNVVVKDQLIDDSERPKEDDPNVEPGPDDPVTPPAADGPQIIADDPINLDIWNVNPESCVLRVISQTGITAFTVDIISDILTPDELEGVGLASHLDLIEGSNGVEGEDKRDLAEALRGFGFPVKDDIKNQKNVIFSISDFLPMLKALAPCDHVFILKVTDDSGTCEKHLNIRIQKGQL